MRFSTHRPGPLHNDLSGKSDVHEQRGFGGELVLQSRRKIERKGEKRRPSPGLRESGSHSKWRRRRRGAERPLSLEPKWLEPKFFFSAGLRTREETPLARPRAVTRPRPVGRTLVKSLAPPRHLMRTPHLYHEGKFCLIVVSSRYVEGKLGPRYTT